MFAHEKLTVVLCISYIHSHTPHHTGWHTRRTRSMNCCRRRTGSSVLWGPISGCRGSHGGSGGDRSERFRERVVRAIDPTPAVDREARPANNIGSCKAPQGRPAQPSFSSRRVRASPPCHTGFLRPPPAVASIHLVQFFLPTLLARTTTTGISANLTSASGYSTAVDPPTEKSLRNRSTTTAARVRGAATTAAEVSSRGGLLVVVLGLVRGRRQRDCKPEPDRAPDVAPEDIERPTAERKAMGMGMGMVGAGTRAPVSVLSLRPPPPLRATNSG